MRVSSGSSGNNRGADDTGVRREAPKALLTDSFIAEATGAGEGGVFFGEGIEAISNVDELDSVLDGSWSALDAEFDGDVEVDISQAEQRQIIEADNLQQKMNQAIQNAFRSFF